MARPEKPIPTSPDPIHADAAYTLDQFSRASGLGEWAVRKARRAGLRVRYVGGRGFVLGADWIDYLRRVTDGSGER